MRLHGDPVPRIIKSLEKAVGVSSYRKYEMWDDWLSVVEATLDMLPRHVLHARTHGVVVPAAEESDAAREVWAQMQRRYNDAWPKVLAHFRDAFHALLNGAESEFDDWLGRIYMEWEVSNQHAGQYFTPFHVSQLMARMQDIPTGLYQHLEDALIHPENKAGQMMRDTGMLLRLNADGRPDLRKLTSEPFLAYFLERVLPVAVPFYEPVLINDCACGSAGMLVAAASTVPRWANHYALVQYSGQDIDMTCVRMARIQMMIHGLNGYGLELELAMQGYGRDDYLALAASRAVHQEAEIVATPATQLVEDRAPTKLRRTKAGTIVVQHGFELSEV